MTRLEHCVVVMGVSGCGKTTVANALAKRCDFVFLEGDQFHPKANVEKMSRGEPLNDQDRHPWLIHLGDLIAATPSRIILSCSALKRQYRDLIRSRVSRPVAFLHLHASYEVLWARVTARQNHFMPPELLQSQFDTLEPLEADELGVVIDITCDLSRVIDQAEAYLLSQPQQTQTAGGPIA